MKIRYSLTIVFFSLGLIACQPNQKVTTVTSPPTNQQNDFYVGNKAPLKPLHFIKLPIGSIKPQGWLREYLKRQRDGMTGHLDQISLWLQKDDNAWLNEGGKYGWEEVPYWLKGYGDIGYLLDDQQMINKAKTWLEAAINSQREDGYFGPVNKRDNGTYDFWPNMIMLFCLQSYYDYSHDERVIDLMKKYYRWEMSVPDDRFLTGYWERSRGGDNLYSVYWLYNRTGEKWLLDLADKIHRNTANWEQPGNLPNWHNVNIAQSFREPATYFMQSQDSADLKATYNDFHLVRDQYGQMPGGMFAGDENSRPGHTDPHQAVETCGMVEQMGSDEKLLRFTGDPMWAENAEDVAFNTYPAAVMPDFKSLRYLTAPNMVVSDSKNHSPGVQNRGPFFVMNAFSNRCCQHNHAQGWPYYAENLVAATPDNGLAALFYNSSETTAKVGDGTEVTLKEQTHYPFEEEVNFTVSTPEMVSFPLYLRIPSWAENPSLKINGETASISSKDEAYIKIEREWKDGDQVELMLPMEIHVNRWDKNKNSASVNYGPLTFSLKIEEELKKVDPRKTAVHDAKWQPDADPSKWPAYEIYPASAWNYGLVLNTESPEKSFEVERRVWPENNFPFTLKTVPIQIKAKGKRLTDWTIDEHGLVGELPQSPVETDQKEESITLVPMGAARIRISSFPVVK